ncbi:Proline hydroxylase OS=Streptomyces alboniger OX=132473 GN=CP975_03900 PE=3 SV=1 [Streptomyces alboniger]
MTLTTDAALRRADGTDWAALAEELDTHGCATTAQLLTPAECRDLAALYEKPELFRTTVDMARHRFGSGEYRYFTHDLPDPVAALRASLYPRLLPIARDWAARLGRPAPWPDSLGEWLERCHAAGQNRSAQILLRYGEGDWNALHRDVFGELLFPLQVVVGLDAYGTDYRAASSSWWSSAAARVARRPATALRQGRRVGVHHPGPPGRAPGRLVGRSERHGVSGVRSALPPSWRPTWPCAVSTGAVNV